MNTFLFRMRQKNLVEDISNGRYKRYRPLITREEYVKEASRNFLDRNHGGRFTEKGKHPVILLPEEMKSDADSGGGEYASSVESIIRHEFNHICGWDMLGRFLAFIVVAVEWFNPLSYYLLSEEIAVSEMLCDMAAVEGRTKMEKSDYIRCVMETVQKEGDSKMLAASLASSGSLLEDRVKFSSCFQVCE